MGGLAIGAISGGIFALLANKYLIDNVVLIEGYTKYSKAYLKQIFEKRKTNPDTENVLVIYPIIQG